MAKKIGERLRELRKIVQLHMNWFTVALLGKDTVTDEELRELEKYGKLPLDESLDLAKKSYVLGRLQATLKSSEYKKLSYEEVEEKVAEAKFTSLEEYAVENAKLHAVDGLKNLSSAVAAGAFERLKGAVREAVNEASVRGITRDKAAMAQTERQPYQKLVSTLAKELKAAFNRDWKRVAATELHRAKQMGTAQAIVNKIGPYKHSDGPDSMVRIIPNPDTCVDCADRYLDENGEPRTFRLTEILQAGSNAESGVKHTRENGKHVHWKTTLPPLHPACGCRLVYAPGGPLQKAVDRGSTSPTIKPPGPPSPGSIPGIPAPGNKPGPGAPSGAITAGAATARTQVDPMGKTALAEGPKRDMVDCPFGGGDECEKHGGPRGGAKTHEAGGFYMKRHAEHIQAGASPTDPEAAQALMAEERQKADAYTKYPPAAQQVLKDIGQGEVAEMRNLKEGMSEEDIAEAREKGLVGLADSFKARIKDNGNAMMKPGTVRGDTGRIAGGDLGQAPAGQFHNHEAAAYDYSLLLGATDTVPPTTTRVHEGQAMSSQQWLDGYSAMGATLTTSGALEESGNNYYKALLDSAPAEKREALKRKADEIICMSTACNGGDDHDDNWMISDNFDDVRKIDNGASFGNSMFGSKNIMLLQAAKASPDGLFHMPDHVVDRMSTMSLGDLQKGLPQLKDWQVGQQFLRQQYMLHLQEQEGGLDPNKFLPTWADPGVSAGASPSLSTSSLWDPTSKAKAGALFAARSAAGQLPHQMFDSFCKAWLEDTSADKNHPHHEAAKELSELGVFMPPGFEEESGPLKAPDGSTVTDKEGKPVMDTKTTESMKDPDKVRRLGLHKEYGDRIKAAYPPRRENMRTGAPKQSAEEMLAQLRGMTPEEKKEKRVAAPSLKTGGMTPVNKGLRLYLDLTSRWG